ncbi:hypothetical protein DICPUDRAFT_157234 [Dictyostelium purpureum]|uniref:Uncharacterized protein n=1 Tax=Dictyostelium purpureum TaxID=5786 RepID=F0ZYM0_DICPU|nr:uncharacterized protein DICPUDRAFT_157234 [Dictyostelium purpureum]EGC30960.1 hypothetical protein DICPUDRAFT_157234 [Dictyostelium purpureum]|eukprot:XP_003292511.1 hypothetical protein DICPUDRAFT_157234 [Dictyostelium purpureum]
MKIVFNTKYHSVTLSALEYAYEHGTSQVIKSLYGFFTTGSNNQSQYYKYILKNALFLLYRNKNITGEERIHFIENFNSIIRNLSESERMICHFEKMGFFNFLEIESFSHQIELLKSNLVEPIDSYIQQFYKYLESRFKILYTAEYYRIFLIVIQVLINNKPLESSIETASSHSATLCPKNIKRIICIESQNESLLFSYFSQYDEIIPGTKHSIVYQYTFSTFSTSGLVYLYNNHHKQPTIPNFVIKKINQRFSNHILTENNFNKNVLMDFIKKYFDQNRVIFTNWGQVLKFFINFLTTPIINRFFSDIRSLRNKITVESFQMITEILEIVIKPCVFKKKINKDAQIIESNSVLQTLVDDGIPVHPKYSINFSTKKILLSTESEIDYILQNLNYFDFGYLLINPKFKNLKTSIYFDQRISNIPKLLIYIYCYIKELFIKTNLANIKEIELLISSKAKNKNPINPFNSKYHSQSFSNVVNQLNNSIEMDRLKNISNNSNTENYNYHSLSDNDQFFIKSFGNNFYLEFLQENKGLMEKIIKNSMILTFDQLDNKTLKPISDYEEILNHLGNNVETNSVILVGLIQFIYYEYTIISINKLKFNFVYFQQELIELFFRLLFDKHLCKAIHLFAQIKKFENLFVSDTLNIFVKSGQIQLDTNIESSKINDLTKEILAKVPSKKLIIFFPILQHLFNLLVSCNDSTQDIIIENLARLRYHSVPIIIGYYHYFYFLNLKDKKLCFYLVRKQSFVHKLFNSTNDYDGFLNDNLFNQIIPKEYENNLIPEILSFAQKDNDNINIELSLEIIYHLNYKQLLVIIRFMFSVIPFFSQVPKVLYSLSWSINDDVLFLLSINEYDLAIEIFNSSPLIIEYNTIKTVTSIYSIDKIANIKIKQENILNILVASYGNDREDIIVYLIKKHNDEIYSKLKYGVLLDPSMINSNNINLFEILFRNDSNTSYVLSIFIDNCIKVNRNIIILLRILRTLKELSLPKDYDQPPHHYV